MKFFAIVSVSLSLLSIVNAAPIITKRRFGQEHTQLADKTYQDMKDAVQGTKFEEETGNMSGAAVRALLAKAPKCEQQDVADQCVDIAKKAGTEVSKDIQDKLIPVCQTYRKLERNTPKDGQPSELCDRAPRNKELNGLTQAQDPTNANSSPPATNPPATNPATDPPATNTGDAVPNDNEAFNKPVGGVQMPLITKLSGDPQGNFEVNGNKFQQEGAAHNRQCDIQHNLCFNKFNSGDRSFQGSDCDNQNNVCKDGPSVFAA